MKYAMEYYGKVNFIHSTDDFAKSSVDIFGINDIEISQNDQITVDGYIIKPAIYTKVVDNNDTQYDVIEKHPEERIPIIQLEN